MESQVKKVIDHIDDHCRAWIERSPFVVISTASAAGAMDVSPKGDPAGFVRVLDPKTLAGDGVPARPSPLGRCLRRNSPAEGAQYERRRPPKDDRGGTDLQRSIEGLTDPAELICEAFVASVQLSISHPLVDRARRHEPESLLGALAIDRSRVLRIGGAAVSLALQHAAAQGIAPRVDPDAAGMVAARLLASFLLTPGPDIDIEDPADVRRYAQEVLTPLLLGTGPS